MDDSRWHSWLSLQIRVAKMTLVGSWHCVYLGSLHSSYKIWPDSFRFFSFPFVHVPLFPSCLIASFSYCAEWKTDIYLWDDLLRSIHGLMIFCNCEKRRDIKALCCFSARASTQSLWHSLTLRYKGQNVLTEQDYFLFARCICSILLEVLYGPQLSPKSSFLKWLSISVTALPFPLHFNAKMHHMGNMTLKLFYCPFSLQEPIWRVVRLITYVASFFFFPSSSMLSLRKINITLLINLSLLLMQTLLKACQNNVLKCGNLLKSNGVGKQDQLIWKLAGKELWLVAISRF